MVIVDGNNVMGQRVGWHRDKSASQQRLAVEVERTAHYRDEPYILVFDVKPKSPFPYKAGQPLFTVRYARPGKSADQVILELVYRYKNASDITVITSDRALTRQIHLLGAKVTPSGIFRKTLEERF